MKLKNFTCMDTQTLFACDMYIKLNTTGKRHTSFSDMITTGEYVADTLWKQQQHFVLLITDSYYRFGLAHNFPDKISLRSINNDCQIALTDNSVTKENILDVFEPDGLPSEVVSILNNIVKAQLIKHDDDYCM